MKVKHYIRRRYWKKIRRKLNRIKLAKLREATKCENEEDSSDSLTSNDEIKISQEEMLWLQREKEAQEKWRQIKELKNTEMEKQADQLINELEQSIAATDDSNSANNEPEAPLIVVDANLLPYRNPSLPDDGNNEDSNANRELCGFFSKTGACRFGFRCGRFHDRPTVSNTLLLENMFQSSNLSSQVKRHDEELHECDEKTLLREYEEFYEDVRSELMSFGRIVTIRTCRNLCQHLRGNVYVQYSNINNAYYAMSQLNGRYFARRRLTLHYVTVDDWKKSVCGLYYRNSCPKKDSCNFLHVFLNPGESVRDLNKFLNTPFRNEKRLYRIRSDSDTSDSIYEGSTPELTPSERVKVRVKRKSKRKHSSHRSRSRSSSSRSSSSRRDRHKKRKKKKKNKKKYKKHYHKDSTRNK